MSPSPSRLAARKVTIKRARAVTLWLAAGTVLLGVCSLALGPLGEPRSSGSSAGMVAIPMIPTIVNGLGAVAFFAALILRAFLRRRGFDGRRAEVEAPDVEAHG